MTDIDKDIKTGVHLGVDIHYLLYDQLGIGMKYLLFSSSINEDLILGIDGLNYIGVDMKENIYVNYIGPSIRSAVWFDKKKRKFKLAQELSIGYAHYREETRLKLNQYESSNLLVTGNTWGANIGISFEYYPSEQLSVGANAGFFYATFKKVEVSNSTSSQVIELNSAYYEKVARIDYSLGVRYHF